MERKIEFAYNLLLLLLAAKIHIRRKSSFHCGFSIPKKGGDFPFPPLQKEILTPALNLFLFFLRFPSPVTPFLHMCGIISRGRIYSAGLEWREGGSERGKNQNTQSLLVPSLPSGHSLSLFPDRMWAAQQIPNLPTSLDYKLLSQCMWALAFAGARQALKKKIHFLLYSPPTFALSCSTSVLRRYDISPTFDAYLKRRGRGKGPCVCGVPFLPSLHSRIHAPPPFPPPTATSFDSFPRIRDEMPPPLSLTAHDSLVGEIPQTLISKLQMRVTNISFKIHEMKLVNAWENTQLFVELSLFLPQPWAAQGHTSLWHPWQHHGNIIGNGDGGGFVSSASFFCMLLLQQGPWGRKQRRRAKSSTKDGDSFVCSFDVEEVLLFSFSSLRRIPLLSAAAEKRKVEQN